MAFVGAESSVRNVNLFQADLVVAWSKIQFGGEYGTMEFTKEIINDWDGKLIFDSKFIEGAKIQTHTPMIFLL